MLATTAAAVMLAGGAIGAGLGPAAGHDVATRTGTPTDHVAARGGGGERLVVFYRRQGGSGIDVGKPGFSSGDYLVSHGVYESKAGRNIAVRSGQCTITSTEIGAALCDGGAYFAGRGRLATVELQIGPGPITRGVVVGGTGDFRGAEGTYSYDTREGGNRLRIVFRLMPLTDPHVSDHRETTMDIPASPSQFTSTQLGRMFR